MYVRPNYGPFAGELQFMRPDIARQLIEAGRATDPRDEPAVIAASEASAKAEKPAKKAKA